MLALLLLKLEKQGTCSSAAVAAEVFMVAWSCARVVSMSGGSGGEEVSVDVPWTMLVRFLGLGVAPTPDFFLQMTLHRTQSSC